MEERERESKYKKYDIKIQRQRVSLQSIETEEHIVAREGGKVNDGLSSDTIGVWVWVVARRMGRVRFDSGTKQEMNGRDKKFEDYYY